MWYSLVAALLEPTALKHDLLMLVLALLQSNLHEGKVELFIATWDVGSVIIFANYLSFSLRGLTFV